MRSEKDDGPRAQALRAAAHPQAEGVNPL